MAGRVVLVCGILLVATRFAFSYTCTCLSFNVGISTWLWISAFSSRNYLNFCFPVQFGRLNFECEFFSLCIFFWFLYAIKVNQNKSSEALIFFCFVKAWTQIFSPLTERTQACFEVIYGCITASVPIPCFYPDSPHRPFQQSGLTTSSLSISSPVTIVKRRRCLCASGWRAQPKAILCMWLYVILWGEKAPTAFERTHWAPANSSLNATPGDLYDSVWWFGRQSRGVRVPRAMFCVIGSFTGAQNTRRQFILSILLLGFHFFPSALSTATLESPRGLLQTWRRAQCLRETPFLVWESGPFNRFPVLFKLRSKSLFTLKIAIYQIPSVRLTVIGI